MTTTCDPIWEQKYQGGYVQRAPWVEVLGFVYQHIPPGKSYCDVKVLEVGCGTALSLQSLAQQGFQVWGIDASETAIKTARQLSSGCFDVGDFVDLPYGNDFFDLVIDHAALSCVNKLHMQTAIGEIYRVLKPNGAFLFTPYSTTDSSVRNIEVGPLAGCGRITFLNTYELMELLPTSMWEKQFINRCENHDLIANWVSAVWRIVAIKKADE